MEILVATALLVCGAIASNRPAQIAAGDAVTDAIAGLATRTLAWFGDIASFCARVVRAMFTRPFEWDEFLRQLDLVGAKSLPLVALAGRGHRRGAVDADARQPGALRREIDVARGHHLFADQGNRAHHHRPGGQRTSGRRESAPSSGR